MPQANPGLITNALTGRSRDNVIVNHRDPLIYSCFMSLHCYLSYFNPSWKVARASSSAKPSTARTQQVPIIQKGVPSLASYPSSDT
jgi:hypothetical protein